MCIAIYKPINGKITEQRLREAYNANPDGWGLLQGFNNILLDLKEVTSFEHFYIYLSTLKLPGSKLIHFRTASSGSISDKYCHPFFVNDNLAFVQNGNIFHYSNYFYHEKNNKTDIMRFNDNILKKLPDGFLDNSAIRSALEKYCKANFTKMIFMDNTGKVDIINEQAGEWVDGCWYSNGGIKNYIGYGYSGAYYYHADEVRHKGGRIANMIFPPSRRKNWNKCQTCGGYFYKLEEENCEDCKIFLELKAFCL